MTSNRDDPASPENVLEALRVYIQPQIRVNKLPNILRLYAHLVLVNDALREQAAKGLEIAKEGLESADDVAVLKRCVKHDRATVVMLPLLLGKAHLRLLLMSTKDTHLDSSQMAIDAYFPSIAMVNNTSPDQLNLFIACLSPEDLELVDGARKEVTLWRKNALLARGDSLPPPHIEPLLKPKKGETGVPGDKDIQKIADKMLTQAEGIVRLAQEYDAMFYSPTHESDLERD
ncbi:hypothetical protein Q8F55_004374 [Vanrija albida]|uniref:Uncharacterized protein n=1 Tax=Vanrija albida TaxID=181172 RepID=A0ABR3Q6L1_9TREE